jgi:hypothetical protein
MLRQLSARMDDPGRFNWQSQPVEIREAYRNYIPPVDAAGIIHQLLLTVPDKYLNGLDCILLNPLSPNHRFVVALRSLRGVFETGLARRPSEKRRGTAEVTKSATWKCSTCGQAYSSNRNAVRHRLLQTGKVV